MKKVAIVTATRAEYGLLHPVIVELRKYENEDFKVELIVTGTHLSDLYGYTKNDIVNDGIRIDKCIEIPVLSDSELSICNNQSITLAAFAKCFEQESYCGIVLLGDRYETLMIAIAAANMRIPIFHLYGGDTTEGAIDEYIRHSITKMSYLHFAATEVSRKRIIQLGESPERVFNFGATGTDNILNMELMSKEEALNSIDLPACKFALCTYHPVTMLTENIEANLLELLDALSSFPNEIFIVTKANADVGGALINSVLDREAAKRDNIRVYSSLGIKRYLSLMKYADAVIGNSSSGIYEAPVFKIPTVNIGDRQRGRLQADSVINCGTNTNEIIEAIKQAFLPETMMECKKIKNPYGDGKAAINISKKIYNAINSDINLMKEFYDL